MKRFLIPTLAVLALVPCGFAIVDVNNNGLSDLWEKQYNNGQLFDSSFDPQGDEDGDSWMNAKEAVSGTNPKVGTPPGGLLTPETIHHPSVWVDTDDDGIADSQTTETAEIKWPSIIGKQYQLYGSPDLIPETWLEVDEPRMGTGGEMGLEIPLAQPGGTAPESLFWRVAVRDVDSDGDGLNDHEESQIGTNPWSWDSDGDWLSDADEVITYSSNPLDRDTDGDWMPDGWEVTYLLNPTDASDGMQDSDEDTLPDQLEYLFMDYGYDPFTANDAALFPWNEDPDKDGLTSAQEFSLEASASQSAQNQTTGTNPRRSDTDADGLPDGWEHDYSLDPNDPSGENGTHGDPDGDGLNNFDEWLNETNPNVSDSDGDGTNDNDEVSNGSNPNNSDDNGVVPPADEMLDVPFKVGDPSDSHSEKWKMMIRGLDPDDDRTVNLASPNFGESAYKTFKLRKGTRYEVSISHLDTDPDYLQNYGAPDYDWEAIADDKPSGTAEESFDGMPGYYNYFTVKDHWIVNNRQAVFTREKHGNEQDIVTGHTATLIPAPIERDKDAVDNNWQKISGDMAKALPGQKINLKINQSRLPSSIVLSNFQWNLPPLVFKDFEANQQTGTLTEMGIGDINQPDVHFYFTNSGTKPVKLSATISGQLIELNVSLELLEPVANFTRILDTVKLYTDPFTQARRVGLERVAPYNNVYHGIQWEGDVFVPAGWPQGKWQWVQTGTPNISVTDNNGNALVFSTNGQTGLDTKYPAAPLPAGSHPGNAGGYPTGVPSDGSNTHGDSPSLVLTDLRDCSFAASFTTWLMFLPHGAESRYVPLKSMTWDMNVTAAKDSISGEWSILSSGQNSSLPETTTNHPTWNINIDGNLVQP